MTFDSIVTQNKFVRTNENVDKAINTKEHYEVLSELFAGNHMWERDRISGEVKNMKILDTL